VSESENSVDSPTPEEWRAVTFLRRKKAVLQAMLDNGVDMQAQATAPGLLIAIAPVFVEMTEEGRARAKAMLSE
jgi:hypothetical protein